MQDNNFDLMINKGYRDTFKATTVFAGVQVIVILVGVLKSKVVAMWLGPYGFGLLSIFNSVISMIYSISNLGLSSSSVRDIAATLNDKVKLSLTIISLRRWAVGTSLIGATFTIIVSPLLSKFSFNSNNFTSSFIFLSLVVLLNGCSYINMAIIQGSNNIKIVASNNIAGAIAGLVISVPLYYFLGVKGIILSFILTALVLFFISSFYLNRLNLITSIILPKLKETWDIGLNSLKLGIMISISFIAATISEFVIKTYIIRTSGVETVGLYQAGWTLNITYLGMIFTAMATDFYPRLSVNASNNALVEQKVNQQAEIALLIIGPLIAIMIIALPLLIKVFFSMKFINIIEMTRLLLFGSLLKAGSWAISFVFLAKGNGKLYLFNELGVRFFTLPIYLFLFHFLGIKGIGWAFIIDQSIYFIWVLFAAWFRYKFKYSPEFYKIFFILVSSNIIMVIITGGLFQHLSIFLSIGCSLIISSYALLKLNEKIGFLTYLKEKFMSP